MSCQLSKPTDAALQAALQTFRREAQPPALVPHPPEKNMAWRTRRIVTELNALKSPDSLANFETELRGVLNAQETRCRTKLMTAAFSDECALRERESLENEEAMQRRKLTQVYYVVTGQQFDVVHLRMVEEMTRRALRRSERLARRDVTLRARTARLFLNEAGDRDALSAQEGCCREELRLRRVVEIGNDLQREIIAASRLSGHLRSVAHSRTVQEARHHLELQEGRDRSAVERLYQLRTILLFENATEDFANAVQKDVVLLSNAGRDAAQQANAMAHASCLQQCVEQEMQLRLLVEEQEAAQLNTLAHGFLLGWRLVYKAITKDPDVVSAFCKLELFLRRDIADQERRAFGVVKLASDRGVAVLTRQRAERRSICQDYVTGARALWADESRAANALLRLHHLRQREASALQAVTVLVTAETASRRGVCDAETQGRLGLKMRYAFALVVLSDAAVTQRLQVDEASDFNALRRRYVEYFYTRHTEQLALEERTARVLIERDESTAAADMFFALHQSLARLRASDASRPLLLVEKSFRNSIAADEVKERHVLSLQYCRLQEQADRLHLVTDERASRLGLSAVQLCEAEATSRQWLCAAATEQLALLHAALLATVDSKSAGGDEASTTGPANGQKGVEAEASLRLSTDWNLPECVEQAWSEVCADWELAENALSAASLESRKTRVPQLLNSYAAQCEELLTEAYLERDLLHFKEHMEWRHLFQSRLRPTQLSCKEEVAPVWKLHSISLKQEPHQRAASVNMWDSNQLFDVSFSLVQQPVEGVVGERTITFYTPYGSSTATVLPRHVVAGMVFFLILDEEGTILASATLVMEPGAADFGYLCVALDNSAGYLRFE